MIHYLSQRLRRAPLAILRAAAPPPSHPTRGMSGLMLLVLAAALTLLAVAPNRALGAPSTAGTLDSLDANIVGSFVLASAVQPDGKTIIAGSFLSVLGVARNRIARINADGTLDTGFDPKANNTVNSVAVQADGKILLGAPSPASSPTGRPARPRQAGPESRIQFSIFKNANLP